MNKPRALEISELVTGMIAARDNARELIEEADLLTSHGRHARAYALLHTACEELGKFAMMEIAARRITLGQIPSWKRFWVRLRSHDSKLMQVELQLRLLAGSPIASQEIGQLAKALFNRGLVVRNAAFYVDEGPEGRFRAPSEIDFNVPLPAIRALAVAALQATRLKGDRKLIEKDLQTPRKPEDLAGATATIAEMLREARDAGMSRGEMLEKVKKSFGLRS